MICPSIGQVWACLGRFVLFLLGDYCKHKFKYKKLNVRKDYNLLDAEIIACKWCILILMIHVIKRINKTEFKWAIKEYKFKV